MHRNSSTTSPVGRFGFNASSTSKASSVAAYQRPTRLIPLVTAENPACPVAGRQRCVCS
jgi:hypothetical protein